MIHLCLANEVSHLLLNRFNKQGQLAWLTFGHQTHAAIVQILHLTDNGKTLRHATNRVAESDPLDMPGKMNHPPNPSKPSIPPTHRTPSIPSPAPCPNAQAIARGCRIRLISRTGLISRGRHDAPNG